MKQVINRLLYDTDTALLLAHDRYWDGSNMERHGRNTFLYVTEKGNYFLHCTTLWQGEHDQIEPLDKEQAKDYYESLYCSEVTYREAFGEEPTPA